MRRTVLLLASMALGVLLAGGVAFFASVERAEAAFPGKNGKIAFHSDRDGDSEIYVMNSDGSDQTRLTSQPFGNDNSPDFSPDGTKIAFYSNREEGEGIYTMNADGSNQTPLTTSLGGTSGVANPTFAPDGTKIGFTKVQDGLSEIYVMNTDGTDQTNLTNNRAVDGAPAWQPVPYRYDFDGFFSPVDNLPMVNKAKAGSAIPVKFSLGGDEGLDIFASGYPLSGQVPTDPKDSLDNIEQTVTANPSGLSYDTSTDRYTYTWKTSKDWAGQTRQLVLKFKDGSEHKAEFKFTK